MASVQHNLTVKGLAEKCTLQISANCDLMISANNGFVCSAWFSPSMWCILLPGEVALTDLVCAAQVNLSPGVWLEGMKRKKCGQRALGKDQRVGDKTFCIHLYVGGLWKGLVS